LIIKIIDFFIIKLKEDRNMATSQVIYHKGRNLMNEGQIAAWRKWTYDNLDIQENFKISDLKHFPDISPPDRNILHIQDAILAQLQEDIILGEISHEDIVFVIIDSSVMCKFRIEDMLLAAHDKMRIENAKFVIVDTHIGKAENNYKMINKDKYPCVKFEILEENLDALATMSFKVNHDENIGMDKSIIKTDFFLDNHILTELEDSWLNKKKWVSGCRNEINDDAQLQILCQLVGHLPDSHGLMISNDKRLIQKTKKKSRNSRLNIHNISI
jgi:hypothetical protein